MRRVSIAMLLFCVWAHGEDWPQFLGPRRDGTGNGSNIALNWSNNGPPVLWKAKAGQGWSGSIVVSGTAILFHRLGDEEIVECLNATNGAPAWKSSYRSDYSDDFGFDEGPRSTPASDGKILITFGANGNLNAWNFVTGANLWQVNTRKEYQAGKGFFGVACSPLIDGSRVILNIGGQNGAGIIAFDKNNGRPVWKTTSEEASYSSPAIATIAGKRRLFVLTRKALVGLDPESGAVQWRHDFQPSISASVTAATPLALNDQIFISASYGAGAELLRFHENGPEVIWSRDNVISSHYSTPVLFGGFLFGFDGRQEQRCHLRCVELQTGKVRWSEDHFGAGHILLLGDALVIITERGELIGAKASRDSFKPVSRAQILGLDCRAAPAFANGLLYARDKSTLCCIDLRKR